VSNQRLLEEIFQPDGLLAKVVTEYEWREEQARMARRVMEAFDKGGILLAEAPTGVGKSLAYLVPAALWARQNGPVVISSYTRTLQDQILRQDAPLLTRLVHPDLRFAVLKGRSNYLCRRRWEIFRQEEGSTMEGEYVLQRLESWVKLTETGDLSEAPDLGSRGRRAQARITSDPRFCQSSACNPQTGCFHKIARRRTREAHIVVVNHSLLMSDLALGGEVLPESSALVIDEAHHLVHTAREHLAVEVSRRSLDEALRDMGGLGEPGATDAVRRLIREIPAPVRRAGWLKKVRSVEEVARRCHERIEQVFQPAGQLLTRRRYKTPEDLPLPPSETDDLLQGLSELGRGMRSILDELDATNATDHEDERRQRAEAALDRVTTSGAALRMLAYPDDPGRVYSMNLSGLHGLTLRSLPLDVGDVLRDHLFFAKDVVVLTSASLAVEGSMRHVAGEIGLHEKDYDQDIFPSPFHLREQVLAMGLTNGPDPNLLDYDVFVTDVVAAVAESVSRKMLVLFTSHDLLARVGEQLHARIPDVEVMEQTRGRGEGGRLSQRFRSSRRAVLLGTSSFWEGVDFPGEHLEILVLTRLPFAVPTDPLEEALAEKVERDGAHPFQERSLPQAILRLRQGFGRLIRRRSDRGIFLVLDSRIYRSGYGPAFRKALGTKMHAVSSLAEVCARVKSWFAGGGDEGGGSL
jgi:ATP-dependent DNA helicase DinG